MEASPVQQPASTAINRSYKYYLKSMFGGFMASFLPFVGQSLVALRHSAIESIVYGFYSPKVKFEVAIATIGTSGRGVLRYGAYSYFKDVFVQTLGIKNADNYRIVGWGLAAGSAFIVSNLFFIPFTVIGSIYLTKFTPGAVRPKSLLDTLSLMREPGMSKFAERLVNQNFKGAAPVFFTEFIGFEMAAYLIYNHLLTAQKSTYGTGTKLAVSLISGAVSGVLSTALYNHQLVQRNSGQNSQQALNRAISEMIKKNYRKLLINGTISTAMRWAIFDLTKMYLGQDSTGGDSMKY